jgi:hypothetical protein
LQTQDLNGAISQKMAFLILKWILKWIWWCELYSSGSGERLGEIGVHSPSVYVFRCERHWWTFVGMHVCDVDDIDGCLLECMSVSPTMCMKTQNSYFLLHILNTSNFHTARSFNQWCGNTGDEGFQTRSRCGCSYRGVWWIYQLPQNFEGSKLFESPRLSLHCYQHGWKRT